MSVANVISKDLSASIFMVEQRNEQSGKMKYFMKGSEWLKKMTNE